MPHDELTPEESQALAEAMLELAEAGKHAEAAELGKLAGHPAELRKVLAGESAERAEGSTTPKTPG